MQLELECRGVKLIACQSSWLQQQLKAESSEPSLVVDLRKVTEIQEDLSGLKDRQIQRVPIPVTAETWSEQDVDAVRREFLRGKSPVRVISTGGRRAALMVLQHVARAEQWSADQALERCPEVAGDPALKKLLQDYLARHQR